MSKNKYHISLCFLFLFAVIVGGCNENPQAAADKKAKEAVEKALNEYSSSRDFDKAQKALKQSLSGAPEAARQEVVLLTQGSLEYGKAINMRNELGPIKALIRQDLDELSGLAIEIIKLQSEKTEIESVLRSRMEDKRILEAQLNGDANGPGLVAKQKDAEDKLAQLSTKRDQIAQSLSEKLKQATQMQQQADELLAKADAANQPEKAQLQQKAYDILKSKNEYQLQAQELQDQINVVESQIAIVRPMVDSLNSEIEKIRKRLDDLNKSDFASSSSQRLTNIGTTSTKFQEEFSGALEQVEQTQSKLASKVKDVTELLAAAQNDFKKITSQESLKDFGRVAAGEVLAFEGRIRGDYALFQRRLAARLAILASGEVTESQAQLKTLAQRYLEDSDEYISKAIADYNDASNLFGKIPVKRDDFSTAVLKNRILILAQKAYLAEKVELMDVKTQTVEQAKELVDKVLKNDPSFESSLSEPPYNILTGKTVEKPHAEMRKVPKVNETDSNQTGTEPNQLLPEPNDLSFEPNQPAQEPNSKADSQSIIAKAQQLTKLMSEGKFEQATASFNDEMKQKLPAEKLAEVWNQLETAGGQFKQFGQPRTERIQNYDAVFIPALWEKNKLDFKVVFDKQGNIAGLWTEAPK